MPALILIASLENDFILYGHVPDGFFHRIGALVHGFVMVGAALSSSTRLVGKIRNEIKILSVLYFYSQDRKALWTPSPL